MLDKWFFPSNRLFVLIFKSLINISITFSEVIFEVHFANECLSALRMHSSAKANLEMGICL